jgi:glucosamine kinase
LTRCLGIDVGGSATRWHLLENGKALRSGKADGFSGHLFRTDMKTRAERVIAELSRDVGRVDRIVAGVTGLNTPSPESTQLSTMLEAAFLAGTVRLMPDSSLAYLTAFQPGEGILVYAGTGSVGAYVQPDGRLVLVGGKGVIIDDAGGGYWIAVQSLRSVLRADDHAPGSGWNTPLGAALEKRTGGRDWPTVRQAIYGAERGSIGLLALAAGEAAAQGDASAITILRRAGAELAELSVMLENRVGRKPVVLAGRAAGLSPVILEGMRSALPGREVRRLELDCAAGAAELATRSSFFADHVEQ